MQAVAQAAAVSYAAVFASLQSCVAPAPAPAPGPAAATTGRQSLQCILLPNTNLDGSVVLSTTTATAGACCDLCKGQSGCNVFAYCPLPPPGW